MLDIILQVIICGIATAAICRIIAYYDGPFNMFPRLREWLIPTAKDEKEVKGELYKGLNVEDILSLMTSFNEILIKSQEIEGKLAIWREYQTKVNPKFYQGLRGTLYALMDCPFCIGPYVSVVLALISTIHMVGHIPRVIEVTHITNWALVASGSLGLHFIISKYWAKEDGE